MEKPTLENIYNYLRLSEHWGTAGQPTEEELPLLREAGYDLVINLLPDPQVMPDEQETVERLGIEYVQIPVIWSAPTPSDFERFVEVMNANAGRHVFVHCAANMRVSAFFYLYRTLLLGVAEEDAANDLHRIWVPNDVWKQFIKEVGQSALT